MFFRITVISPQHDEECSDEYTTSWCETFVRDKVSLDTDGNVAHQFKRTEMISIHDATDQMFRFSYEWSSGSPPDGSEIYVYVNNEKYGPYQETDSVHRWVIDCDSKCDCLVGSDKAVAGPASSGGMPGGGGTIATGEMYD